LVDRSLVKIEAEFVAISDDIPTVHFVIRDRIRCDGMRLGEWANPAYVGKSADQHVRPPSMYKEWTQGVN